MAEQTLAGVLEARGAADLLRAPEAWQLIEETERATERPQRVPNDGPRTPGGGRPRTPSDTPCGPRPPGRATRPRSNARAHGRLEAPRPSPLPIAAPWTAAIEGLRASKRRTASVHNSRSLILSSGRRRGCDRAGHSRGRCMRDAMLFRWMPDDPPTMGRARTSRTYRSIPNPSAYP